MYSKKLGWYLAFAVSLLTTYANSQQQSFTKNNQSASVKFKKLRSNFSETLNLPGSGVASFRFKYVAPKLKAPYIILTNKSIEQKINQQLVLNQNAINEIDKELRGDKQADSSNGVYRIDTKVSFNRNSILSLKITQNQSTSLVSATFGRFVEEKSYHNYNLKTGEKITLYDLIEPKYLPRLVTLYELSIRKNWLKNYIKSDNSTRLRLKDRHDIIKLGDLKKNGVYDNDNKLPLELTEFVFTDLGIETHYFYDFMHDEIKDSPSEIIKISKKALLPIMKKGWRNIWDK